MTVQEETKTTDDATFERPPAITTIGIVNSALRGRWLVIGVAMVCVALVIVTTLMRERTFVATTTFMPADVRTASPASGLAAQFGISLPGGGSGESPQFYVDIIKSREILNSVVESKYPISPSHSGTVADIYHVNATDPAIRHQAAVGQLKAGITAETDAATGIIRVSVGTPYAMASDSLADELLNQVIRFNRDRRRSRAKAEREFTEQRLAEVGNDLRASESRQQSFLEANRDFVTPALRLQQERVAADVAMRRQLYAALAQAYEQAKIEEVRVSPVITVIDRAEIPLQPEPRRLRINALIALSLGLMLGLILAVVRDYFRSATGKLSDDITEFGILARETRAELARPWRLIRPRARGKTRGS